MDINFETLLSHKKLSLDTTSYIRAMSAGIALLLHALYSLSDFTEIPLGSKRLLEELIVDVKGRTLYYPMAMELLSQPDLDATELDINWAGFPDNPMYLPYDRLLGVMQGALQGLYYLGSYCIGYPDEAREFYQLSPGQILDARNFFKVILPYLGKVGDKRANTTILEVEQLITEACADGESILIAYREEEGPAEDYEGEPEPTTA